MFEILKTLVILTIAVPFIYILLDVTFDLARRAFNFLAGKVLPVPAKVRSKRPEQQ